MAKLTARFELEDRVSKKLRRIQKGFKDLEKRQKKLSRPFTMKIKTKTAEKTLKKLNVFLKANLKSWQLEISAVDKTGKTIDNISNQLKQKLPGNYQFSIVINDQATPGIQKIRSIMSDLSSAEYSLTAAVNDRVTPAVQKISGYMKGVLQKGYSATLYVIDKITQTASRISSYLKNHLAREYQATLTINDQATAKLSALQKKLNSIEAKRILKIDAIVKTEQDEANKGKDGKAEAIWTEILKAGKSKFVKWVKGLPEKIWDKSFDAILGKLFKGEESGGGCCCCGGGGGSIINEPATSSRPGSEETTTNGETGSGRNRSGGKFMKGLRKVGKVGGKALPYAGALLSATELMDMNKENAGEKVGSAGGGIGGGLAGAAAGAAIGTAILPVGGTAIGGAIGGMVGSLGGSSIGEYFGKMFDDNGGVVKAWNTIKDKSAEALGAIQENWSMIAGWFTDNVWNPVVGKVVEVATGIWNQLTTAWTMIQETFMTVAGWFAENVWNPVVGKVIEVATGIWNQLTTAWTMIQETFMAVAGWFAENVWDPVVGKVIEVATGIWNQLTTAWTMIQETFTAVAGWFAENVWNPVVSKVIEVATGIWNRFQFTWNMIKRVWGAVSSWFINTVWNPIKNTFSSVKEAIGEKFQAAKKTVTDIWEGVAGWFEKNIQKPIVKIAGLISDGFEKAFGWVGKIWEKVGGGIDAVINFMTGEDPDKNATGGYITKPTISWIGEAGNEFVIPTENNRGRGKMLLAQAATKLGMRVVDDMGAAAGDGGASSPVSSAASYSASVSPAVGVGSIAAEAQAFGREFTGGFDKGIGSNAPSLDQWKQKNISKPFSSLPAESSNYGKQTVAGFASGQNASATGTGGFLQAKVNAPYQTTVKTSSSWGANTVKNFASGQNATPTGTSQYVDKNINKPFLDSKQSAAGWGSGMIGHFISGMNGKGSEVSQAAKNLAKKVEKAFREELDIHSPSRVMMNLGRFASVGIVKGLSSVDVKSFAEKQAGSLAAAFSGIGAVGGNVKSWLMQAIMATGSPVSWLQPLSVIAQKESGGNPRASNGWDINAKRGDPSRGLMQTIGQTFNAYKGKGMNDIFNPVHNAVAAINYIKSRYGSPFNTPGIKSMARGGAYKGYANGGLITSEQIARVGEGGKREWIIPEERGIRGRYLLQRAAGALGMEVHDPAEGSGSISSGQAAAATAGGARSRQPAENGAKEVNIYITGDNHYHSERDQETLIAKIKRALVDELERDIHIGTKGSVAYD
ncbi:transglycosylase SLT domain-containing protein [Bacillus haynesii]|uniref:transglycosylase SLT domain-containing protein n=1 Tax=Bacillus haynesii TaxID=1925021 RepID=UPI00227DBCFA|nr:transglycosylase SLT domain-containing protein [Bacillus haynesii]MCY8044823.1 transglycosylase SLT domain-containing protein [Bacillus haynesii]MCY8381996.1 transglycosylase SLT domain-containing protein [Bacillus haynesii]MCY8588113.1 transglycosylase SLT domain-containing protein [Bacillus haynesii]MEC0754688.1 transglycosylase SLT domain-containing protein [Bacillus haynesii]